MALAYLDHGPKAQNASAIYSIFVNATAEALSKATRALPYDILQKDEQAHILYDKASQTHAYVAFKPLVNHKVGPLCSLSHPGFVMLRG